MGRRPAPVAPRPPSNVEIVSLARSPLLRFSTNGCKRVALLWSRWVYWVFVVSFFQVRRRQLDESGAQVIQRLALMPAIRGDSGARFSQARAVGLVALVVRRLQRAFVDKLFGIMRGRPIEDTEEPQAVSSPPSVLAVDWQWDETSQRIRALLAERLGGERSGHGKVGVQVIVQAGMVREYRSAEEALVAEVAREPVVSRSMLLEHQSADYILEAVLRSLPFDLADRCCMQEVAGNCDHLLLTFCVDRAAANMRALSWVFEVLQGAGMPPNVFPHVELCAAHGVALVKSRARGDHDGIVQASHSLSALMRQGRSLATLRDAVLQLVNRHLEVRKERRPADIDARGSWLADLLYSGSGTEHLWVTTASGEVRKGRLLMDLQAVTDAFDLGADGSPIVHWCHKDGAIGKGCCNSREEAVEKTAVPLLNWLIHRSWDAASVSRWTYVLNNLRKIAVGFLSNSLLPKALAEMQVFCGVTQGMERMLAKMLAADEGNFSAREKLRLLKICQSLCKPKAAWQIATVITVLALVDKILWSILGFDRRHRATLGSLLDESSSPLAMCQRALLDHLSYWSALASHWALFAAMGGMFDNTECRRFARMHLLTISASLLDHFELRMAHPPYSLLVLASSGVGLDRKMAAATRFRDVPDHCLNVFCRRLRRAYPGDEALLRSGSHLLKALADSPFISVDKSERLHASMRVDLRSTGRARCFTTSSDRIVCQEVRAEHQTRSGVDPSKALVSSGTSRRRGSEAASAVVDAKPDQRARATRGGARMVWQNHKMSAFKAAVAPARPLTNTERKRVQDRCSEEWPALPAEEKAMWEQIALGDRWAALSQAPPLAAGPPAPFVPLWGQGPEADRGYAVPPSEIAAEWHRLGSDKRRRVVHEDPALRVAGVVEARSHGTSHLDIFGCGASKKNICRATLAPEAASELDELVKKLNAWVKSLGIGPARSCQQLVWLRGERKREGASGGHFVDAVLLLIDCRFRPNMQFFGRCILEGASCDQVASELPPYPYTVNLASRPARLSPSFRTADIATSDEISLALSRIGSSWEIRTLVWEESDSESLLSFRVTGASEVVPCGPAKRSRTSGIPPCTIPAEMLIEDPLAFGRAAAQGNRQSQLATEGGLRGDSPPQADSGDEFGFDAGEPQPSAPGDVIAQCIADLMESDLVEAGELALFAEDNLELGEFMLPAAAQQGEEGQDDEPVSEVEEQAALKIGEREAMEPAPSPEFAEVTPEVAAAGATISDAGYISSQAQGWQDIAAVGRITTWPSSKPVERRSVGCRCYLHPGCTSAARSRQVVDDQTLLRWLFSGQREPGATRERQHELAKLHKAAFFTMAPSRGRQPAASSSSAA